ncbi:MAG: PQQ-dependent sugar dehydrogenase [Acidimicrobiia bacterium]|nr:PQQ-dependent sugar dehydrogenase [Acidimicrobiia bacterium]RZV45680.1 MAG: glucose dehydrogenase [Acidimicrobiia bacterium]
MYRLVALLFLVSLAAACGGSDETPADTTPVLQATTTIAPATSSTTTPPSSTTTTTVPPTTTTTVAPDPLQGLALESLATGLDRPTFVTGLEDGRLLVLEAIGRVRVVDPADGLLPEPFLNIRNKVGSSSIEQGLLGLALHPNYQTNGRFFVYYTDRAGDSVLAEYGVGDDPNRAEETAGRILLEIEQPDERHNAGMLQFGPEGYLYIATGDGGAGGARVNGQNPNTLLSGILRIDIDQGDPYAVPADNPFADGVDGAPEVWAFGLRNPWRFSIDGAERLLYIGDVGQESREEIDVVPLEPVGYNFGWPSVEGTECFFKRDCILSDYVVPVIDYGHDEGLSVTGGVVYRGSAIPELTGHYFYADWVRKWIRSFRYESGAAGQRQDWTGDLNPGQINSFGLDATGEILIATWDGSVARIVPVR